MFRNPQPHVTPFPGLPCCHANARTHHRRDVNHSKRNPSLMKCTPMSTHSLAQRSARTGQQNCLIHLPLLGMWCCVPALSLPGEHQGARTKSACAWNYSKQRQNISDQVYLPICLGCNQLLSAQSVLFHTSQIWRWRASDSGSNSHHFYTASLQKHLKVSVSEDAKQLQCSMKQNVLALLYPPASSRDPPPSSTKFQANLSPPTSLPQALLSSFISFCQALHLKSVSQKGRAAKLRYRALRQLTELCWRQMEENTWPMP